METVYFGIEAENEKLDCYVVGVAPTQEQLSALLMGLGLESPSEEQTAMVNAIARTLLEKAQEALAAAKAEARGRAQAGRADDFLWD